MTSTSSTIMGAALFTVAAAATIAAISFHVFGNHLLKDSEQKDNTTIASKGESNKARDYSKDATESTTSQSDAEEINNDTTGSSKEASNEVLDSSKETTESPAPQSQTDAEEISSPTTTQKKPITAKGKKWRDRLAAKKDKKATSSSENTEQKDDTTGSSKEDSNEVMDSSKETTESPVPQLQTDAEEGASPTTPQKKPTTAKGKKWKDRLAAKKDKKALELKLSKDNDATATAE